MRIDSKLGSLLSAYCVLTIACLPVFSSPRQPAIFGSSREQQAQREIVELGRRFAQSKSDEKTSEIHLFEIANHINDVAELKALIFWCHFSALPVVSEIIMRLACDAFIHRLGQLNTNAAMLALQELYEYGDFGATTDYNLLHTYCRAGGEANTLKKRRSTHLWIKDFSHPLTESEIKYFSFVREKLDIAWKKRFPVLEKTAPAPLILNFTVDDKSAVENVSYVFPRDVKRDTRRLAVLPALQEGFAGCALPGNWKSIHCSVTFK